MDTGASVKYEVRRSKDGIDWMTDFQCDSFNKARDAAMKLADDGWIAAVVRVNRKVVATWEPKGK